jgi:hemoglobin
MMKNVILVFLTCFFLTACASQNSSTYQQLGGLPKVEEIVDNFISEIEFDPVMFEFFKDSDINRFREKLIEHLCLLTGGPCQYTGDTMEQVHGGMNITESTFNHGVDLFINAMTKADIPHPLQNKVLATMIHTRDQMTYR